MDRLTLAREISEFLDEPLSYTSERLEKGFHHNHHMVAENFRSANPQDDDDLLEWYRWTDAYIYELAAYHTEPGFNYAGMIEGAAVHLKGLNKKRVLVLGDGIGDLSIRLYDEGLTPFYHDLEGSKTAAFAKTRFGDRDIKQDLTSGWDPKFRANNYDAVVAHDFLEHVTDVEAWTRAIYKTLRPEGQFQAQNAFAIGSGEAGSIPMHLERNDHWEHDWIPLMLELGFIDQGNGWWTK